jgi:hypothetical protein
MPPFIADQIRVDHNPAMPRDVAPARQPVIVGGVDFGLIDEAIHTVGAAFPWHTTIEGEAFWFGIVKRLHRIKESGV